MNVKKVKLNKKSRPKTVTLELRVDEAAAIAKKFGQMSYKKFTEEFPTLDYGVLDEIYGCLTGEFFNHYWDDGVDGALRGDGH